ncbi:hypothetical protein J6590_027018 [Homalodisca vitripennis]|nr:hypothetical protein J6590_027018 [Homalodisca vitripennis]
MTITQELERFEPNLSESLEFFYNIPSYKSLKHGLPVCPGLRFELIVGTDSALINMTYSWRNNGLTNPKRIPGGPVRRTAEGTTDTLRIVRATYSNC